MATLLEDGRRSQLPPESDLVQPRGPNVTVTYDFTGKVVLVTGAGSGMGRASSIAFADAGARVAVLDINSESGAETVKQIEAAGGEAVFFEVDVADDSAVRRAVDAVVEQLGRLDVAHNNAGAEGQHGFLLEQDPANWRRTLDVNLSSVFYCMQAEIPHMLNSGGGSIINTASAAGLIGAYGLTPYVAAKHGVVGLTKAAANEFSERGIRINALCPGPVETPFISSFPPSWTERLLSGTPIRRLAQPDEISQAVLWLGSDASSYVVGASISVDGGVTIGGAETRVDDLDERVRDPHDASS
jgi:NAD(P)-dependent dehydrogenase (short-subunit alcohol dehydrogenase family)